MFLFNLLCVDLFPWTPAVIFVFNFSFFFPTTYHVLVHLYVQKQQYNTQNVSTFCLFSKVQASDCFKILQNTIKYIFSTNEKKPSTFKLNTKNIWRITLKTFAKNKCIFVFTTKQVYSFKSAASLNKKQKQTHTTTGHQMTCMTEMIELEPRTLWCYSSRWWQAVSIRNRRDQTVQTGTKNFMIVWLL